jgi:hypothetical protein
MNQNDQLPNANGSRIKHNHSQPKAGQMRTLSGARLGAGVLVVALILSACSATPTSTTSPNSNAPATLVPQPTATSQPAGIPTATNLPQPTATAIPTATKPPAAAVAPQQQAVNTQLDPCVLVPSSEASSLAGTTFGQGVETSTPGGLKICTYGTQGTNIFTAEVIQAPDVATAQAAKEQFLTDLQASLQQITDQGINVTQLPDFADGAVLGQISFSGGGMSFNGSAMGFLKGTIFVGISDVVFNGPAPSSDALQAEATTVLGRLP